MENKIETRLIDSKLIENDLRNYNNRTNLNMFDDHEEIEFREELRSTSNSKMLDDDVDIFFKKNSIKSLKIKVNQINLDNHEKIQNQDKTNYLKIIKPKAVINLLSKENSFEEKDIDCENISMSHQVLNNKENFIKRDDIISNSKHLSSSSPNRDETKKSSNYSRENSFDIDAKFNKSLLNKKDDTNNINYLNIAQLRNPNEEETKHEILTNSEDKSKNNSFTNIGTSKVRDSVDFNSKLIIYFY